MGKYEDVGKDLPDTVPERQRGKSVYAEPVKFSAGIASLLTFILALSLGIYGFNQNYEIIVNFLNDVFSANPEKTTSSTMEDSLFAGWVMMLGAGILLVLSLAFAGASLVKGKTGILGLFVIIATLSPFAYALYSLFFAPISITSVFPK